MIKLSNGLDFEYITASGAMGSDGYGWPAEKVLRLFGIVDIHLFVHIMKTITLHPKIGNFRWWKPWDIVRFIWKDGKIVGTVNAFGLGNRGYNWWHKNVGLKVDSSKVKLIGSIYGEPEELEEMARRMNDVDIVGLEINVGCPNLADDILFNTGRVIKSVIAVKKISRHPILLKGSVTHDFQTILSEIDGMVEALDINSVPWHMIFPDHKSPLKKFGGGGVSGKIAQPFTWRLAEELRGLTDIPVIFPSLWDSDDLRTMRIRGFPAGSFGSVHLPFPWRPTSFVRKEQIYAQKF
jgi:dihydroorotate dehydrogenase